MSDKEKQLEEIEQVIYDYVDNKQTERVYLCSSRVNALAKPFVHNKALANALYNAGYRKVEKVDTSTRAMLNIRALLQDFDEMGYAPTNLCDAPEEEAKKWKQNLFAEINSILDENIRLQAENNELNEKLRGEKQ